MLKSFLSPHLRNEKESVALMKLSGYVNVLKKALRFTATRADMKRFFNLAEKERFDKIIGNRADAIARFVTDKKLARVSTDIPPAFLAKPGTPYTPKPGSSAGKQETIQKGAVKVERAFRNMIRSLFSIGGGFNKQKANKFAKTISTSFTKTIK